MKELLIIAISSALVSNVVLSQFLGICSFVGVSKKVETAAGMGGAVIFVITIACAGASGAGLSEDDRVYPGYRCPGADRGNVLKKVYGIPL